MEIRFRNTGEVMTDITFRATYYDRVIPTLLTEEWLNTFEGGCDVVFEGPQATPTNHYEYSFRDGVEQIDGKWFSKYSVGPVFTDQITDGVTQTAAEQRSAYEAMKDAEQAKAVRADRNRRIAELDWTQGKDIPDSISGPAAVVRQALRDVPAQPGFPWTIDWPTQPE